MRTLLVAALFVASSASFSGGQQASPSESSPKPDAQPARVKVYAIGPGVTAPELLPFPPPPALAGKCKNKANGTVVLSVIVDSAGQPRNIMFLRPLGTDLDKIALQVAAADRFKPGTHDGVPVAVGQSVEMNIQACVEQIKNDAGKKTNILQLRSKPVQKFGILPPPLEDVVLKVGTPSLEDSISGFPNVYRVGNGVTAPVALHLMEAEFSDEARREKYQGICMLSMIVDTQGMPQNVSVTRPLGKGLDEKAVEAVRSYRFKPALRDGQPVAVIVAVEVAFHLY